jgi:integrase
VAKILNKPLYSEMVQAKETKQQALWVKLHHIAITCNLEGVSQNYLTMKVKGNGQGKVLTQDELRRLFSEGFLSPRDRALFGICLFTGCRVSEALALQTTDIKGGMLTFRKSITKGKLKTRVVDIQPGIH